MTLRIVFMGTPEFSVPTLLALHKAGHDIVACYCQPPRPAGRRGLEHLPSPVQIAAEKLSVPVCSPTSLKDEAEQKKFAAWNADLAIVVAYGLLLPQKVLDAPRLGCFNGHASLLPRWRGAAPIQRAIMAGDNETGTMVMKMEIGLDTGPVALSATVPIEETTTAGELHDALSVLTANLMVEAMTALENDTLSLTPQPDEGVIYAEKISKAETRINWNQPADHVRRHINGLSPFPGSWCEMELGGKLQRVKILQAAHCDNEDGRAAKAGDLNGDNLTIACSNGAVRLLRLQKAGSKPMDVDEFMRGNTITNRHLLS